MSWSVRYAGRTAPLFSNLGPPAALGIYRPRFPAGGISVGAVFWLRRPILFNLGPPGALCVYRSPVFRRVVFFGRCGILAESAPYFPIYGLLAPWGSIGPVSGERYIGQCSILAGSTHSFHFRASWRPGAYRSPFPGEWYLDRRSMLAASAPYFPT